jgi:hypothetical protein
VTVRRQLLDGLRAGLDALAAAGCRRVWLDGSFVIAKDVPHDFDACWDPEGIDLDRLAPVLLDLSDGRVAQHRTYGGALMRADVVFADLDGKTVLDGQRRDYRSGRPKGIVQLDPRDGWTSAR